jgi:hypothetical protein
MYGSAPKCHESLTLPGGTRFVENFVSKCILRNRPENAVYFTNTTVQKLLVKWLGFRLGKPGDIFRDGIPLWRGA